MINELTSKIFITAAVLAQIVDSTTQMQALQQCIFELVISDMIPPASESILEKTVSRSPIQCGQICQSQKNCGGFVFKQNKHNKMYK